MNNIIYELWQAGTDKMELWDCYESEEKAVKVARKKKENGFIGTISIYKVTTEQIIY